MLVLAGGRAPGNARRQSGQGSEGLASLAGGRAGGAG